MDHKPLLCTKPLFTPLSACSVPDQSLFFSSTGMSKEELLVTAENYNSIYLNNLSAFCARLSCGSLLELCKAVATGQVLNGVAIVRPPGHHAEPDEAGGFCLFNNVAVAARYLQRHHRLKKIFILDWLVTGQISCRGGSVHGGATS